MAVVIQSVNRLALVMLAVVCAVVIALSPTESALAHGGPLALAVSTDGAGGLTVTAMDTEDRHPINQTMDPVATATSADGQIVGPVSLVLSQEGVGLWITEEPFIPIGDWSVTVSTKVPLTATTTVDFTVAALADPPDAEATAEADSGIAFAPVLWIGGVLVVLAAIAGSVIVSRRRIVARRK